MTSRQRWWCFALTNRARSSSGWWHCGANPLTRGCHGFESRTRWSAFSSIVSPTQDAEVSLLYNYMYTLVVIELELELAGNAAEVAWGLGRVGPVFFVLVVSKGCKPGVSPPFQRNTVNFNHCARFVCLSGAIDETDPPS